jgi:hypothetical protein
MASPIVLHASNDKQVDNPQKLETPVSGPGDVNFLIIYTGTACPNWTLGPDATDDTRSLDIILEEDFASKYIVPIVGWGAAAFVALASETRKFRDSASGDSDSDDWDFEIADVSVPIPQDNKLHVLATLTNDERDSLNRIAYQISVPVRKIKPLDRPSTVCSEMSKFGPWSLTIQDSDRSRIQNPSALEFIIDAPNGANRLLMFTGDALVSGQATTTTWKAGL